MPILPNILGLAYSGPFPTFGAKQIIFRVGVSAITAEIVMADRAQSQLLIKLYGPEVKQEEADAQRQGNGN